MERWTAALAWQRSVDRALRALALTHTQFLVLRGAAAATAEQGDAVMQQCIADAAGLDKVTTFRIVNKLGKDGLLDKNINGMDDRKLRIFVTREGKAVLAQACIVVDAVAAALEPTSGEE